MIMMTEVTGKRNGIAEVVYIYLCFNPQQGLHMQ